MKLNVTVEIIGLDTIRPSDIRNLPKDLQMSLQKMPQVEHASKSILIVDAFPPKIIDNKAISRYFPMTVERSFGEAVALLRDCDNLVMKRGSTHVRWTGHEFLDRGKTWSPTPHDILSQKKEWYVYSEVKSDSPQTELPSFR